MSKLAMLAGLLMVHMPEKVLEFVYRNRESYRGEKINPKALALGRLANTVRIPGQLPTIKESRLQSDKTATMFDRKGPLLSRIEDIEVQGADGPLNARIYSDCTDLKNLKPAMVYFHGGGFVQGGLESHNEICAKLAKWSGGIVVAVDYRLAPEHPFPQGVDDALTAFIWLSENATGLGIDCNRMGVGGDSAGGCFAGVVAAQTAGTPHAAKFQVLIYPVTDAHLNSASINELEDAYVLPKERMTWYRDLYGGGYKNYNDPKFSPLFSRNFSELPNSYVLTGGFDPLCDDGIFYVEKLSKAGTCVTHRHFAGQIHAFLNLTRVIPQGTIALREIAKWLEKNW